MTKPPFSLDVNRRPSPSLFRVGQFVKLHLRQGQRVERLWFKIIQARGGQEEGITELKLFIGRMCEATHTVRQNHGKGYAQKKKAAMLATLEALQKEITAVVQSIRASVIEAPTAPDEAE